MKYFLPFATGIAAVHAAQPLDITFDTPPVSSGNFPMANWESQAQPVGNGRIGAMVFGNPLKEHIQFNDISLWTGGLNPSGGYNVNEFGSYQNFGDLFLDFTGSEGNAFQPVNTSGHDVPGRAFGDAMQNSEQSIISAGDGNPASKWCVEHKNKDVIWQVDLGSPTAIPGYSFTSADDIPARDPRTWRFEGSQDGKNWTLIDQHQNEPPFANRAEKKSYKIALEKAEKFQHYRFVFVPAADAQHFQVAEITLDGVSHEAPKVTKFTRSLDLATGIHTTTFTHEGVVQKREVFASHPDNVIVIRITADKPGKAGGSFTVKDAHNTATKTGNSGAEFSGKLSNGLAYAAALRVISDGGKVTTKGDRVSWTGNAVTILLAASTDYALDAAKNFRSGVDPTVENGKTLAAAVTKGYSDLRSAHVADFTKIMGRVNLDLGAPPPEKSITKRLEEYRKGTSDPHLESLIFQFGRYLLISSSRGFLPANLQGLWNESNKPAWYSDYHTNINIQMNYWLAEPANLSDCALPLFAWTKEMIPGSTEATKKAFGEKTRGWTMRTSANIYGGNGWDWNIPASAWLALHYMEHYAFTEDREFLEKEAWPVFKGVSEFWLDHLVEKDGKLLAPKAWSPEHGPREDGVAHDQQIIWDLFTNTLAAAEILGRKDDFTQQVAAARAKLLGPEIGSWGQLKEWTTERPQLEKSGHRHTSHLFAVFPGNQISLTGTPDLAKAAAVSLEARGTSGDSRRSWTWPWRTALWSRLGRPDKAGQMVRGLLVYNTLGNLFTTHPPFQIDGNLGITAGMCEMLVQSHAGEISLLPAVSPAWKTGSFEGLKARGGFEIGAQWADGKPVSATVKSLLGKPLFLRVPGNPASLAITSGGKEVSFKPSENGAFRLPTTRGTSYTIKF